MTRTFQENLEFGNQGEMLATRYYLERGCGVVPSYLYNVEGAPRLQLRTGQVTLPDLDVLDPTGRHWAEVKTMTEAPLFRYYGFRTHGVKRTLVYDYLRVAKMSGCPVRLLIWQRDEDVLLGADLAELQPFRCLCGSCRDGVVGRSCLTYYNRDHFAVLLERASRLL